MRLFLSAVSAILVAGSVWPVAALAQAQVAVVEDIAGEVAGIEFMDYVSAGKVIRLGKAELVLGYMKSCWRETITGGVVTVGLEQSEVSGGSVKREKVGCDGGKLQLTADQASKSGTMVFRKAPGPAAPAAQFTLYGLAPLVEIKQAGKLIIERLDKHGERIEVNLSPGQLIRGAFYDFAKTDKALAAGGLYRASLESRQVVFKVDELAKPGTGPLVGRLLRFPEA